MYIIEYIISSRKAIHEVNVRHRSSSGRARFVHIKSDCNTSLDESRQLNGVFG